MTNLAVLGAKTTMTDVLSRLRLWLRRHPGVERSLQSARAIVHFGPWRHVCRAVIRLARPPRRTAAPAAHSLLGNVATGDVVQALRDKSVCVVGCLPAGFVQRLRATTDHLPTNEYANFYERNAEVCELLRDATVLDVLRRYFGSEPELLECTIVVHEPMPFGRVDTSLQRHFHFDYAGWQSLNLFVYLTDVDEESAAHQIATGSHKAHTVNDSLRACISEAEAERRFGSSIRTVTGPAGTAFFENTEAFHRRGAVGRRRVMLNLLFASHRGLLSTGRNVPLFAQYVDSQQ